MPHILDSPLGQSEPRAQILGVTQPPVEPMHLYYAECPQCHHRIYSKIVDELNNPARSIDWMSWLIVAAALGAMVMLYFAFNR
ncbi:MAG: hypothetical protein EA425_12340 [Puniceicoccaceae bacterium]|nr:MAG: hypothetical protein EA425_12340 [Puniceicoccaceae bacterium]